jgi:hypothetical protein
MRAAKAVAPSGPFIILILALSQVLISCEKSESTKPTTEPPVSDWWAVDDCEPGALYSLTGTKWANMQPAFCFSTNFPEAWRGEAEVAAATWNGVGSRLQIVVDRTPVPNAMGKDGHNVLSFGQIMEYPTALGLTYCWFQGTTQTEVDIVISSDRPITIGGGPAAFDLRSVLVHEFGHFCGLGDVFAQKQTMSYEQHLDSRIYQTLCPGDMEGLRQLYP